MSQLPLFEPPREPVSAPPPKASGATSEVVTRDTPVRAWGQEGPSVYTWGRLLDETLAALGVRS